MNKKGFTLIEMLAVIMLLGILTTIAVVSYTNYLNTSREKSFNLAENSFKDALLEAYVDCKTGFSDNDFCSKHSEPNMKDERDEITLLELIEAEHIEKIKNPYNTNEYCDINNSYIEVISNADFTDHSDLSYKVCLICGNKSSEDCN